MPKARATLGVGIQRTLTDAAATTALQDAQEDLGDLLLEVFAARRQHDGQPGGTRGAEQGSRAPDRRGGVRSGQGQGARPGSGSEGPWAWGSIALAEGIEGDTDQEQA